jgi:hypothetical protein
VTVEDPKLLTPEWQAALNKTLPHLSRYQARLDAISADIRTLEKALTESGFRIYTATKVSPKESLAWMDSGGNAWRIGVLKEEKSGFSFRSLIETPTGDRLRISKHIPQLLEAVAEAAGRGPVVEPLTDDDIPF